MPAPLGYMDMGGGKAKVLDPVRAPLVKRTFELYGTGRFSFETLAGEIQAMGLRSRSGKVIGKNHLTRLLTNPFYIGLLHIKRSNETYPGVHEPLLPKSLFDRVQDIMHGRTNTSSCRHDFLFRRRLNCGQCQYRLIGVTHNGIIHYRGHTQDCPTTTGREEGGGPSVL